MAPKSVMDCDNFSLELLCVALMIGRAHKKSMKDSTSFLGLGPLKIHLARCWCKTVSVVLFLHNINHFSLPVVGDIQCYQREALTPG